AAKSGMGKKSGMGGKSEKSGTGKKGGMGGKGLVVDSGSRNNTSRNILTFFCRHAKHEVTIVIRLAREVK
ncbi:MAG: hypothetical protein GXY80_13650, partial [Syntrophorhabdus aromaticivorans]|nr:hypothetical protein [Syntrophorhabdus aromaticivorans]